MTAWARTSLRALLIISGSFCLLYSAQILTKAWFADVLIESAWGRRLSGDDLARPWPWADTAPVARLRFVEQGVDRVLLSGHSGEALSFAPGLVTEVMSGGHSLHVISAHRDTHFRVLRHVQLGDRLNLQLPSRDWQHYRVLDIAVIDFRKGEVQNIDRDAMLLTTCYPFEDPGMGSTLRYVVLATREAADAALATR